jgi:hypothetical protein
MNDTFNTKRFLRLLKKTLLERPVQMFGFAGLLLAVVFIMYVLAKAIGGFESAQNLSFIWGLPVSSCFFASLVFGYFATNASGSSYLTLPASHFEKWLCGILIAGILYPIIFLLFFRIMDSSFVSLFHNSLDPASPFYKEQFESVYIFDFNGTLAWRVYPMFFLLTGASFVGAFYFNKIAFIKVAIVIAILIISVVVLNLLMAKITFGNIVDAGPFNHVTLSVEKEEVSIMMPGAINKIFYYSLSFVLPAILWLLAFTRLREKEF